MRIYAVILFFLAISTVVESDDLLTRASEQARSSLPIFWQAYEAGGRDPYTFEIKAKVVLDDGSSEIVWIGKLKRPKDGVIEGAIMRKPGRLEYHRKVNRKVRFTSADILDWGYRHETEQSAKIYGHFTTRIMLENMPLRDQNLWKNTLSAKPLPPSSASK